MSEQINDGGPAYPVMRERRVGEVGVTESSSGMSLRDAFALALAPAVFTKLHEDAMAEEAMANYLDKTGMQPEAVTTSEANDEDGAGLFPMLVAVMSYTLADAMLEARKRPVTEFVDTGAAK